MEILFRDVTMNDSRILFTWHNDGLVRKFSRSTEYVTFEKHSTWLSNRLDLIPNEPFWLFESSTHEVGTTRFDLDLESGQFEVSITINPLFHGMGFGRKLLEKSIVEISKVHPGVNLYAEIHKENEASRHLFLNFGFVEFSAKGEFQLLKRVADTN